MGESGWTALLAERERLFTYAREQLRSAVEQFGERVLTTPRNRISIGVSLSTVEAGRVSFFGSQLFARNVSGARAVTCAATKNIDGVEFVGWGSSADNYPTPYFTFAAAIGMHESEIDAFCVKLVDLYKREAKRRAK